MTFAHAHTGPPCAACREVSQAVLDMAAAYAGHDHGGWREVIRLAAGQPGELADMLAAALPIVVMLGNAARLAAQGFYGDPADPVPYPGDDVGPAWPWDVDMASIAAATAGRAPGETRAP